MKRKNYFENPYNYDDVEIICPFCKSKMIFMTVLIDEMKLPHYVDFLCPDRKCRFKLRIVWEEFERRIKK